jgi:hypothetical protein
MERGGDWSSMTVEEVRMNKQLLREISRFKKEIV